MEGMMMNMPLRISSILEFAKTSYPEVEIISKMSSGEVHRTNYRDISIRSKKMANALLELKVSLGDRAKRNGRVLSSKKLEKSSRKARKIAFVTKRILRSKQSS